MIDGPPGAVSTSANTTTLTTSSSTTVCRSRRSAYRSIDGYEVTGRMRRPGRRRPLPTD